MYTILLTSALSHFHSCLETAFGNLVTLKEEPIIENIFASIHDDLHVEFSISSKDSCDWITTPL